MTEEYDQFALPPNVIARYQDLQVYEWSSGYEIEHIPSGKTHWMSDGVDMFTKEVEDDDGHGFHDEPIYPGSQAFNEAMRLDLELAYSTYMEAYFPQIAEDEDSQEAVDRAAERWISRLKKSKLLSGTTLRLVITGSESDWSIEIEDSPTNVVSVWSSMLHDNDYAQEEADRLESALVKLGYKVILNWDEADDD